MPTPAPAKNYGDAVAYDIPVDSPFPTDGLTDVAVTARAGRVKGAAYKGDPGLETWYYVVEFSRVDGTGVVSYEEEEVPASAII